MEVKNYFFLIAFKYILNSCGLYLGLVNLGLSWKVFIPLGRLCYAAYLINLTFIRMLISRRRNPSYISDTDFMMDFLGFLTATFFFSFIASLLVEMPFLNLDKLLLTDHRNNKVGFNEWEKVESIVHKFNYFQVANAVKKLTNNKIDINGNKISSFKWIFSKKNYLTNYRLCILISNDWSILALSFFCIDFKYIHSQNVNI